MLIIGFHVGRFNVFPVGRQCEETQGMVGAAGEQVGRVVFIVRWMTGERTPAGNQCYCLIKALGHREYRGGYTL